VAFEDNIMKMQLENASDTISESDYGTHTLIVYQNLETIREFYSYYVKKELRKKMKLFK
jgi:hypothetical protein